MSTTAPVLTSADHLELGISLERLVALLRRLSPAQDISLTTASTLHRLEQDGPHRLSELAAREGVSQPAMTQLVSRLERDGYAQRKDDPTDARVVMVHPTEAGTAFVRERRRVRAGLLGMLTAGLAAEDQAAIAAALPALARLTTLA